MDWITVITGASVFVSITGGVITWEARAHRLAMVVEGRVNGHDQLFEEREKLSTERHEELKARLTRIENKLDVSNRRHV